MIQNNAQCQSDWNFCMENLFSSLKYVLAHFKEFSISDWAWVCRPPSYFAVYSWVGQILVWNLVMFAFVRHLQNRYNIFPYNRIHVTLTGMGTAHADNARDTHWVRVHLKEMCFFSHLSEGVQNNPKEFLWEAKNSKRHHWLHPPLVGQSTLKTSLFSPQ